MTTTRHPDMLDYNPPHTCQRWCVVDEGRAHDLGSCDSAVIDGEHPDHWLYVSFLAASNAVDGREHYTLVVNDGGEHPRNVRIELSPAEAAAIAAVLNAAKARGTVSIDLDAWFSEHSRETGA